MYVEQVGIPNQLCLGAPWDETMRATSDCRSTFLWRGAHLVYFDLGDTSTTYYMQAVGNLLKRARSTTPDDDSYKFNFVSGKIIPFSNSKLCLKLVGQTSVEFSQDELALVDLTQFTRVLHHEALIAPTWCSPNHLLHCSHPVGLLARRLWDSLEGRQSCSCRTSMGTMDRTWQL